jgi:hypothetical protein
MELGTITKEEASKINHNFVKYHSERDFSVIGEFIMEDMTIKKGDLVLVFSYCDCDYKVVKITSVGVDASGEKNSKVRVTDGVCSWRIDNCSVIK